MSHKNVEGDVKGQKPAQQCRVPESTSMAARCSFEETMAMDLGTLLDAGEGALVTLVAGEARLTAHRAVLAARSPAFAAMLCHGTQEASSGQVAIPDVEGPVLRHVLAYVYTLQAPQLPGMAPQLLAAADKFGLSGLKSHSEAQVATQLAVENAAATAVLAIRHSSTSLRQAAIAFIRAHWIEVLATKGWADALRYQTEDVIEVSRLLAEPQAEVSTPAAADSQPTTEAQSQSHSAQEQTPVAAAADSRPTTAAQSQFHTEHGQSSATAAPPTPPHQTPTPQDDAISRLRTLSAEEKGWRLIQAAKVGRVEEVEALLAVGADVGARDGERKTALYWAAFSGHLEVVRRLLGAGAEVDAREEDNWTPLHGAAWTGQEEAAAALLAAGADKGAMTKYGSTPLDIARWQKNSQQFIDMLR